MLFFLGMENKDIKKEVSSFNEKVTLKDRIFSFFVDVIISLILSLVIFNLVIFQISRPIISYDNLIKENEKGEKEIFNLLYEHELLFFDDSENSDKYSLSDSLSKTFYYFCEFLVKNNEETSKYDVFYNYFVDIKKEDISFLNDLKLKFLSPFFEEDVYLINNSVSLKEEYQDEFILLFKEDEEMSVKGYEDYANLSVLFTKFYEYLLNDIKVNDLVSLDNSTSYLFLRNKINENDKIINDNYFYCALITFFLVSFILFFIYPVFSKKKESIGENLVKVERIKEKDKSYINKLECLFLFLIKSIECFPILFLIPFYKIGIKNYSSYLTLYILPFIGFLFILFNLIFILVNKRNKNLFEVVSKTYLIKEDRLS